MSKFKKPELALDDVQGMVDEALSLNESFSKATEECPDGATSLKPVSEFQDKDQNRYMTIDSRL